MPDNPFTAAWARQYLAGRALAPGSMALEEAPGPIMRTVVNTTDARGQAPISSAQPSQRAPGGLSLVLPIPVSLNALYQPAGNRIILTEAGRTYKRLVIQRCIQEYRSLSPLIGSLIGTIELYPPDRRRRDLANLEKVLGDALQDAGVYDNDCQFDEWHFYRRNHTVPGYVRFTIQQRTTP